MKKKLLNIAIPATVENLLQTLVGFVDTLMISKIGLLAVTAVGVANTLLAVYLAIFIAVGVGTSTLVSQSLGKANPDRAKEVVAQSTVLTFFVGLCFSLITLLFGKQLLAMMGATKEVMRFSQEFFYLVGGTAFLIALMTVFSSILRATGDAKTPMKISVLVNLLNIVLDYILIFGWGPIPALGVVGTAIGTVVSRLIGCLLLYRKINQTMLKFTLKDIRTKSNFRPLINLSIPAALERLVMRLGQVVYFGLIVAISAKTFAAHTIAGNIESFTYMPGYGLAAAAATTVGFSIGANNKKAAREFGFLAVKYGIGIMTVFGIILFFGSPYFARMFTADSQAISKIVIALRIDAFIQPILAISLILTGALQGMGDTKSPLYSTAIGMWFVRVLGVILFSRVFDLDIAGVWLSILIDIYLRAFYLTYKFRKNLS